MHTIVATMKVSTGWFFNCIYLKAKVLKLARIAATKHSATPIISSDTSFLLSVFLADRDSMIIPIVLIQKTITSCLVMRSFIMKYAIIEVKNGFSKINITFEVEVILRAMKMSRWAQVVPITLIMT